MKSLSNLSKTLGPSLFIAAYFVKYWIPDISENAFDIIWNTGIIISLFGLDSFPLVVISTFLKWRLIDEIFGDPYTISAIDFFELLIAIPWSFMEYRSLNISQYFKSIFR